MPEVRTAGAEPGAKGAAQFDVFLSYNSRDREIVERIAERLKRGGLEPWLDKWSQTPGGEWQAELGRGIEASRACAVFVGPSDLGAWGLQELAFALDRSTRERDFRVFPVLLPGVREPFDPTVLPHFLRTRTWVDFRRGHGSQRALQDLIAAVKGVPFGPSVAIEPWTGIRPYRGLQPFGEEDAELFFGRDREVQRLVEMLKGGRFLAVVGASGSGKSSLVRAGLVPALRAGALPNVTGWTVCVLEPGADPLGILAARLVSLGNGEGMQPTVDALGGDPRTLHLASALALSSRPNGERLLLVVDQLEETFTLANDEEALNSFFDNLIFASSAAGGRCTVAVTLRSDFYPRLAAYSELAQQVSAHQFLLTPMERDGLSQVIEEPARLAGMEFESGLVATILDDVASQPGALPLLEHALLELWERRRGRMLTLEGYRESGGVSGALATRAEAIYGGFDAERKAVAKRVLLRLTQPGEGTEDTRRQATMNELVTRSEEADALEDVVGELAHARMLTVGGEGQEEERRVDVSHEALIRGWQRLRGWVDEDRAGLQVHRRLREAAQEWQRLGRDEALVHRGALLTEADEWRKDHEPSLNDLERAFLDESLERQARHRRAARRRRRLTVVGLLGAIAITSAFALVFAHQARIAADQRDAARRALSRELATRSAGAIASDPGEALSLALDSLDKAVTPEGDAALRQATLASRELLSLRADPQGASSVSASPDGRRAVSDGGDGIARLWDVETGDEVASLPARHGPVDTVRYSPSGRRIAVGYDDGTVVVTDASLRNPRPVDLRGGYVSAVAFDRADATLAAAVENGVRVISLDGPLRVRAMEGSTMAYSVDITADGTRVASGDDQDERVRVWNTRTRGLDHTLPALGARVTARFSPDGTKVLGAGEDVRIWNTQTGGRLNRWSGGGQPLWAAGVTGDSVVAAGEDGIVRVWAWNGAPIDEWRAHPSDIMDVSFMRGDRVISAGVDGTVRISHALSADAWDGWGVQAVDFDPDQRLLAGGNGDGTVYVWNTTTHARVETLRGSADYTDATFSPRGDSLLINRTGDGSVRSWHLGGGPQKLTLSVPDGELLNTVEFDRTGDHFVWSTDKRVVVHDVDSREDVELHKVGDDMRDARISPDGSQVAAAGVGGVIKLWRLDRTEAPYAVLKGHENDINTIAWSPDGDRIVSAGHDGTARVWNVNDRTAVVLRGHEQPVTSALFTDAGTHVLTASDDGTVRLWDVRGDRAPVVLEARAEAINDATLAPDGRTIASTGADGNVRVFECEVCGSSGSVLELARSRPG